MPCFCCFFVNFLCFLFWGRRAVCLFGDRHLGIRFRCSIDKFWRFRDRSVICICWVFLLWPLGQRSFNRGRSQNRWPRLLGFWNRRLMDLLLLVLRSGASLKFAFSQRSSSNQLSYAVSILQVKVSSPTIGRSISGLHHPTPACPIYVASYSSLIIYPDSWINFV